VQTSQAEAAAALSRLRHWLEDRLPLDAEGVLCFRL